MSSRLVHFHLNSSIFANEQPECRTFFHEFATAFGNTHTFKIDCPRQAIITVFDQHLLRRTLSNLLSNATKYSPKNTEITMRVREQQGSVIISIQDQGIGIPEKDLPTLFKTGLSPIPINFGDTPEII